MIRLINNGVNSDNERFFEFESENFIIKERELPSRGMRILIFKKDEDSKIPEIAYSNKTGGIVFDVNNIMPNKDEQERYMAELKEIQNFFVDEALCPLISLNDNIGETWINI